MDIRTSLVWKMLNLKYQLINQVNLSQRQQMCISVCMCVCVCVCVCVCISKVRERVRHIGFEVISLHTDFEVTHLQKNLE